MAHFLAGIRCLALVLDVTYGILILEWAIEWGKFAYARKNKDFIIGRILVDLATDCFDLFGNVKTSIEFQEVIKVMIESKKIKIRKKQ